MYKHTHTHTHKHITDNNLYDIGKHEKVISE